MVVVVVMRSAGSGSDIASEKAGRGTRKRKGWAVVKGKKPVNDKHRASQRSLVDAASAAAALDAQDVLATKTPPTMAVKLMKWPGGWKREILSRAVWQKAARSHRASHMAANLVADNAIIPIVSAAAMDSALPTDFVAPPVTPVLVCKSGGSGDRLEGGLQSSLMMEFPFALCMPLADRNLLEVIQVRLTADLLWAALTYITVYMFSRLSFHCDDTLSPRCRGLQSERLAADTLVSIRQVARQIGNGIEQLHANGLVHGDIKVSHNQCAQACVRMRLWGVESEYGDGANIWQLISCHVSRQTRMINP